MIEKSDDTHSAKEGNVKRRSVSWSREDMETLTCAIETPVAQVCAQIDTFSSSDHQRFF